MSQNLDLESWQKKQKQKEGDFHDHTTNAAEEEYNISNVDGNIEVKKNHNYIPKINRTLPKHYIEAMAGDEIIDVLTSNVHHERFLWIIKIIMTIFCLFFISIAFSIIITQKQPIAIIFAFVPLFMIRQIFRAKKKRYIAFGHKSFYYAPLMRRAIDYNEVKNIQNIKAEIMTGQNNPNRSFQRTVLQFIFYDEIDENDLGGEARMLKIKTRYGSETTTYDQACIFPQPFDQKKLHEKLSHHLRL